MPMNSEPSEEVAAVQQRRQANILLLRLQWLVILLLIAALLWLYISQQRFQYSVNERLQSNEQVVSRLNEMDDRLFAVSQQTLPEPSAKASSQAQNQLDLLRIQIQAVDRLLADNKNSAAIELLRGLHWQLAQSGNEIAPALTVVIKQSLLKDIERLEAKSAQPSPWQLQNLAIQNIQEFLHNHERVINTDTSTQKSTSNSVKTTDNNIGISRRQLTIHEVIMTLNLASQASNMREHDQLISYLTQARKQLQTLVPKTSVDNKKSLSSNSKQPPLESSKATKQTDSSATNANSVVDNAEMRQAPKDISEVVEWLDQLIANAPKPTPLLTTQILNKSER